MRKHFPVLFGRAGLPGRTGLTGRTGLIGALMPLTVLPLTGASAHAAGLNVVIAAPLAAATGYATRSVTITHGQTLSFAQLDPTVAHSVTSRETFARTIKIGRKTFTVHEPYFDTRLVKGPGSFTVQTASLKPGVYHFYCTLHENMTGTLTVK